VAASTEELLSPVPPSGWVPSKSPSGEVASVVEVVASTEASAEDAPESYPVTSPSLRADAS
jgi:hypothetical protein